MQDVTPTFKAHAVQDTTKPVAQLLVSWLKQFDPDIVFFTIGVSTIGGTDPIKGERNTISSFDQYEYVDESAHLLDLTVERQTNEPIYSAARAIADLELENTGQRFTPDSDPTIGSYIKPKRPVRIYLGFDREPQEKIQIFVGELSEFPLVDNRRMTVNMSAIDFANTIWNVPLEETQIYLDKRSDELIEILLQAAGFSGDNYELDTGLNTIAFAYFKKGQKIGEIIEKICEAELAVFYADENGTFRFENLFHYNNPPHDVSVLTITDDIVLEEKQPDVKKIVNVAEITAHPRSQKSNQVIWRLPSAIQISSGQTYEFFIDYDDPIVTIDTPAGYGSHTSSYFRANTASDESGLDVTADFLVSDFTNFAEASKLSITNNSGAVAYLTAVEIWGTPAKKVFGEGGLYYRYQDDTSVAEYEENVATIDNDFIQNTSFANSISQFLVNQRKDANDYLELTVRGQPHLQIGDLVTRNSLTYYINRIVTKLNASDGLIQELVLVSRNISDYFTIGVSTIGGVDIIAP